MSDSDSSSWPDDEGPFSSIDENSSEENDVEPSNHQEDETNEESGESIEEIEETVTSNENMEVAQWSLQDQLWMVPLRTHLTTRQYTL